MKGKSIFTTKEADLIKATIDECVKVGRYNNSRIHTKLRVLYEFYISNYNISGKQFTSSDFDHHVSIGNITIED